VSEERRPRIVIVATGGTIANTADGRLGVDELLADLADVPAGAKLLGSTDVRVVEAFRTGGATFTPSDWQTIGARVADAAADTDVDGIVVTHGTVSVEETAYYLHLTIPTSKPVVVTCAQRQHRTLGADGPRNLLDSIRVASDPVAASRGVVLVLDELVHSARDVTKTSRRPSGFSSGTIGPIGSVDADAVTISRSPVRRHTVHSEFSVPLGELPRVDIVSTYAGADGVAIEAFVAAGAAGIVVNGFAARGRPHPLQVPALAHAVNEGVAVVVASRGGDGRIPAEPDGDFVTADSLSAQKARVLLGLALLRPRDRRALQQIYSEY
jgi:L-asparaginase